MSWSWRGVAATFQDAAVDIFVNDLAETANGTQTKFTDNAKLRAVANTSRDNIVINKPMMVKKNAGKEKRGKTENSWKQYRKYMFSDVKWKLPCPHPKGDLFEGKYEDTTLWGEEIPCSPSSNGTELRTACLIWSPVFNMKKSENKEQSWTESHQMWYK